MTDLQKADLKSAKEFLSIAYKSQLFFEIYEKVAEFIIVAVRNNDKNSDSCTRILTRHIGVGSGTLPEDIDEFDFPGEYSVIEFVKKLQEEYKDKL